MIPDEMKIVSNNSNPCWKFLFGHAFVKQNNQSYIKFEEYIVIMIPMVQLLQNI